MIEKGREWEIEKGLSLIRQISEDKNGQSQSVEWTRCKRSKKANPEAKENVNWKSWEKKNVGNGQHKYEDGDKQNLAQVFANFDFILTSLSLLFFAYFARDKKIESKKQVES